MTQTTAPTWAAVRDTNSRVTVLSDGHDTEDAARAWLIAHFEAKIAASDWAPTRAQYVRIVASLQNGEPGRNGSTRYEARQVSTPVGTDIL